MRNISYLASIIFIILISCKENKNDFESNENKIIDNKMDSTDNKLIDGLDLNNSLFKRDELELKKYFFNNVLIENIKINDLLNKEYRESFFKYLKERKNEDDFKTTFFTRLLFIRIQQLSDSNSFFILTEISKNSSLSSDGIELLGDSLVELFFQRPDFFIKQGTKYGENNIVKYTMSLMKDFLVNESFFEINMGSVELKNGMLFLEPKMEKDFSNQNLINILNILPKHNVIFSPSLYSEWQNKTIIFKDIKSLFGKNFIQQLNNQENDYFQKNVKTTLDKYFIRNYHVNDPDGFVNLRESPSSDSVIKGKLENGKYACFVEDKGDWVLVQISSLGECYVFKSKLKSE
jgi:hypothetical protein